MNIHFIKIYDFNGKFIRNIVFKTKGTIRIQGYSKNNNIYILFQSFTTPYTIYKYLFKKDKLIKQYQSKIKREFNQKNYKLEYKLIKSKDNTKIPAFIVYNKKNMLDKPSPAYLYTYGGFGISEYPFYKSNILPFLNKGGIYIVANIRGGGEFGNKWYYSAKGAKNKIKSIEDFTSVSKYLIDRKYTDNNNLFINGISNGGFIISSAMTMMPNLYKGAIAEVPIVDFLIYKKYGIGSLLVDEYGDPDKKEDLKYILKWSPYQKIKKNVQYPDLLITGAVYDTRVGIGQSLKFAKKMQDYSLGKTFLYVYEDTGHSGENNIDYDIDNNTMIFSFIYKTLNQDK